MTAESECLLCEPGNYCEVPGLTSTDFTDRKIAPGHYSTGGAKVKYPVETRYQNETTVYPDCLETNECGLCHEGHRCELEGNSLPNSFPCPSGTYSNRKGLKEICSDCPPGMFGNKNDVASIFNIVFRPFLIPLLRIAGTKIGLVPVGSSF